MPPQSSYSLVLCGCRPVEYRPFRQCRHRPPTSSGPRQNSRSRSRTMNLFTAPRAIQKLTIEITTLCNLKCAGCPRTMGIANDSWIDQHMDLKLFRRILDGWPETGFVTLHGIGEPTLHPQFVELVAMARQSGKFKRLKAPSTGYRHRRAGPREGEK